MDGLLSRNFLGETPLLHAARAAEPGAFVAVADMLPEEKVRVFPDYLCLMNERAHGRRSANKMIIFYMVFLKIEIL